MVTLCPSEVPDALERLRACSERPRDVEDKIAGDGLAERFRLLADAPFLAQSDRRREARSGLVLARNGGRMDPSAMSADEAFDAWQEADERAWQAVAARERAARLYHQVFAREQRAEYEMRRSEVSS